MENKFQILVHSRPYTCGGETAWPFNSGSSQIVIIRAAIKQSLDFRVILLSEKPPPPLQASKRDRPHQRREKFVWRRGKYLSLPTSNPRPRPTTTYAEMHSSHCYSGITSVCSVLSRASVKSRLNTAPSYRAILAGVSVAERVQIWCRAS